MTFDWPNVANADGYTVQLKRNGSHSAWRTPNESQLVESFRFDGVYCAHVTAKPRAGSTTHTDSAVSSPACVTISELTRPDVSSWLRDDDLWVQIETATEAAAYEWRIGNSTLRGRRTNTDRFTIDMGQFAPGDSRCVYVKAVGHDGTTTRESSGCHLMGIMSAPELSYDADNDAIDVSWDDTPGATSYQVRIEGHDDDDFRTTVRDGLTASVPMDPDYGNPVCGWVVPYRGSYVGDGSDKVCTDISPAADAGTLAWDQQPTCLSPRDRSGMGAEVTNYGSSASTYVVDLRHPSTNAFVHGSHGYRIDANRSGRVLLGGIPPGTWRVRVLENGEPMEPTKVVEFTECDLPTLETCNTSSGLSASACPWTALPSGDQGDIVITRTWTQPHDQYPNRTATAYEYYHVDREANWTVLLTFVGAIPVVGELVDVGFCIYDTAQAIRGDGSYTTAAISCGTALMPVASAAAARRVDEVFDAIPNQIHHFADVGSGPNLIRRVDVEGVPVSIKSGHGYRPDHGSVDITSVLSRDAADSAVAADLAKRVNAGESVTAAGAGHSTFQTVVDGNVVEYRAVFVQATGRYEVGTYYIP